MTAMRNALLAAVCLLACWRQRANIDCNGYHWDEVRDLVTLDINNKKAPACDILNNSRHGWRSKVVQQR
jgi:hypothetical protein